MSIFTIKRSNEEFAKWWDRWASRLQGNRVVNGSREAGAKKDQKVHDLPYALEILRRFPHKNDL